MSACEHYQQQISQLLDGELPPEQVQTLRAHLRTCPECQRVYDDFLALQAAVRDAAAAPPADLTARIMQQVRQEPVPMPPRSAASMILTARRSFTEPPGLKASALT